MLLQAITQFNWVDIFVLAVLFRVCYIGLKNGLPAEIFKLFGTLFALYFSLHYYTLFTDLLRGYLKVDLKIVPLEFVDFGSFIIFACLGYAIFIGLRIMFLRLIKMEAVPQLNKWGGLALSVLRGYMLAGLLVFALVISSVGYFKMSVKKSFLGNGFFTVAPATYTWLWKSVVSKFTTKGVMNPTVQEVQDRF